MGKVSVTLAILSDALNCVQKEVATLALGLGGDEPYRLVVLVGLKTRILCSQNARVENTLELISQFKQNGPPLEHYLTLKKE